MSPEAAATPGWLAGSLLAAIVLLILFAALAYGVMAGRTAAIDDKVRTGLHAFASPAVTAFFRVITQFGSPIVQATGTPLIAIVFWRFGWKRRAVLYLVAMAGGSVLLTSLKEIFRRARPESYFSYPLPNSYSFPSGHALLSLCFFGVLAAFLSEHQRSRAVQMAIWITSSLLILLIGISRVYLSVHYFTDVVAGYLAAGVWSAGVAWGYHRWSHSRRNRETVTGPGGV